MADNYSARDYLEQTSAADQYLTGQDVVLRLDLEVLRVAAATCEILHPVDGLIASPAVTLPTVTVTTTGVAAELSDFIPATGVDAADLEVGRSYLLDAPGAPPQQVVVKDVEQGVGVRIQSQLSSEYPVGAVLRDTHLLCDAGALDRARSYRARWTLTPASTAPTASVIVKVTPFDVVLQPFELQLTWRDVIGVAPSVAQLLGEDWRELLRGATRDVLSHLDAKGLEPDRVFDTRPWTTPAAYWVALALLADESVNQPLAAEAYRLLNGKYQRAVANALAAQRTWYDLQDTGVADDAEERKPAHFWAVDRDALIEAEESSS